MGQTEDVRLFYFARYDMISSSSPAHNKYPLKGSEPSELGLYTNTIKIK